MLKKYYQLLVLFLVATLIATSFLVFSDSSNLKNIFAYNNQTKIISQNLGDAEHSDIALNNENGVIVWQEKIKDWDIFAQRINKYGEKAGNVFKVNQYSVNDQKFPQAAMDKDGNFVVVWQSYFQDRNGSGVYGQKFKANGQKWGNEFKIHSFVPNNQILPDVAMNDEGIFVATWASEKQDHSPKSIYAKIFNSDGTPMTNEIEVNLSREGIQTNPKVAINFYSQIIIVWQSFKGGNWDIYSQSLNLNGEKLLAKDFLVNNITDLNQTQPSITADSSNKFIVLWSNKTLHPILETPMENIMGRILNGMGMGTGTSFDISYPTFGHHDNPSASFKDGHSVIAWQDFDKNNWQIWMQRLDGNNNLSDISFKLYEEDSEENSEEEESNEEGPSQEIPVIVMDSDTNYHLVWTNTDPENKQKKILYKRF